MTILNDRTMTGDYESELVNSENERIAIKMINRGPFAGNRLLCLFDDLPGTTVAIHLLDDETIDWLLDKLKTIKGIDK